MLCSVTWREFGVGCVDAGASGNVLKPRGDPLRVRSGEQLLGRLAELQDLRQHGDPLIGVLDASHREGRETLGARRSAQVWKKSFLFDFLICTCHSRSLPHRSVGGTLTKKDSGVNGHR